MARTRKPHWEELKQHELLQVVNGLEVLSHERLLNLIEYLEEQNVNCYPPEELLYKPYLTQREYESIPYSALILDSRQIGENNNISRAMKERILKKRDKNSAK